MQTDKLSITIYFLLGTYFGFLVGSSLEQESAIIARKFLFIGPLLFIVIFWRRIETKAHKNHLKEWDDLQPRGKWYFILTRYVLYRGTLLFAVLIAPAIPFSTAAVSVLAFAGIFLLATLVYFGNDEWRNCEEEIQILTLRQTGEFIASKKN